MFYQVTDSRLFAPATPAQLFFDDLVSITAIGLADVPAGTISDVWETSEYVLWPVNAASRGQPFTWITPTAAIAAGQMVLIDGVWGWPAIPDPIHRATLIEAQRLYRRRDAVFGVTGNPDFTPIRVPAMDPDVRRLVRPFRRKDLA